MAADQQYYLSRAAVSVRIHRSDGIRNKPVFLCRYDDAVKDGGAFCAGGSVAEQPVFAPDNKRLY